MRRFGFRDDFFIGSVLSLEMAREASTAAEHTLQRALAVEADIDKLVAYISVTSRMFIKA